MNLYPHGYSEDDLDEARAAGRREAAEGLRKWLRHADECGKNMSINVRGDRLTEAERPCTCGLEAALQAAERVKA